MARPQVTEIQCKSALNKVQGMPFHWSLNPYRGCEHACLCVLGAHLRLTGLFRPLEARLKLKQKVLKYPPAQKLEMLFVALLAGAKSVYHTATMLGGDWALQAAFGLPGCAEQ